MPTVLFVCVENTFRSIIAESLFNAEAPPGWRAVSAGVDAGDRISPSAAILLAEVGVPVSKLLPLQVTERMIEDAERVVTFGCVDRCPSGAAGKTEDWPVPGSTGKSDVQLREIRGELQRRVRDLVVRLQNRKD
jgi:arsenate reductase